MNATVTLKRHQFERLLALAAFGLATHTVRGGEMRRKIAAELHEIVTETEREETE